MIRSEDIRTVSSIADGIITERKVDERRFIDYCPGNGSRYELLICPLDGLKIPGCEEGYTLISLKQTPRIWRSYPFRSYATCDYIQEKLDVSIVDALVLHEIINFLLGHKSLSLNELVQFGNQCLENSKR